MNVNQNQRKENYDYFIFYNTNLNNQKFNKQGKIQEELITIKANNTINNNIPLPRKSKIKELEISLKPNKINSIISPKNEPYLKPKFHIKNRNSFCIKNNNSKNKYNNSFKTNDIRQDINLNLFKLYYDEQGEQVKIIKDKNFYIDNQNNNNNNNDIDNNSNYKTNNKIGKSDFIDDLSSTNDTKNTRTKKSKNSLGIKSLYLDTPSQSTTRKNKSGTKSIKTLTKNGTTNSKKLSNSKNKNQKENKLIKKEINYEKLNIYLEGKKNFRKMCKTYKDIYNGTKKINNNNNIKSKGFEKIANNNKKTKKRKDILTKKINFDNHEKDFSENKNDKKKFISHKNNLSFNMTFERENIKNILNKVSNNVNNTINNNIKKLYISSIKTRNIKESKKNNLNKLDNIYTFNQSTKNAQRNTVQFNDNYLIHFFKERKKDNLKNNSFGYNNLNLTNNNSYNNISRDSLLFDKSNLSFNCNLFNNNSLNNFINDKKENILKKTKNILKLNDKSQKFLTNINSQRCLILDNYKSKFESYPKRIIQQSHKNFREKIINIPNLSYFMNSKTMNQAEKNIILDNYNNKRTFPIYYNKNFIKKEKNNISFNNYYNNAVYKNNNLTIDNININPNSLEFNKNIGENFNNSHKKNIDTNKNINKLSKLNYNLKKFINRKNQVKNLPTETNHKINDNINNNNNNIFKFNRNKSNLGYSSSNNTGMNDFPSLFQLNRSNLE